MPYPPVKLYKVSNVTNEKNHENLSMIIHLTVSGATEWRFSVSLFIHC